MMNGKLIAVETAITTGDIFAEERYLAFKLKFKVFE